MKNIALGAGFAVFLAASIGVGISADSYGWAAAVMLFYVGACFGAFFAVRNYSNRLFRNSQFALAVFCRAENNRFYLHNEVELRPGYLGRWIEFKVLEQLGAPDMITYFRSRFLRSHKALME